VCGVLTRVQSWPEAWTSVLVHCTWGASLKQHLAEAAPMMYRIAHVLQFLFFTLLLGTL
jgi:hypothetical protein